MTQQYPRQPDPDTAAGQSYPGHGQAGQAETQYRPIEPRNALGIAALALGLVGMLFGLVPVTGFIAVALGIVGVILALSNRGRLRRGTASNRKSTWFGLATSLIAIALGFWGISIVFDTVDELDRDLEELEQELDDVGD